MPDFDKKILYIGLLLVVVSFGLGFKYGSYTANKAHTLEKTELTKTEQAPATKQVKSEKIFVYVVGAVEKSGVLTMEPGTRVFQAVEQAKPTRNADLRQLNLAAKVSDEETIFVPKVGQRMPSTSSSLSVATSSISQSQPSGPVNLNTATVTELDSRLPGVGPSETTEKVQKKIKSIPTYSTIKSRHSKAYRGNAF